MDASTELLNPRATIGDNQPSPFDLSSEEIDGLYEETGHWLSGQAVRNQAEADGVSKILDALRSAEKIAKAAKKVEKDPLDEAVAVVQEKWRPVLDRVELASKVCKAALKPFLEREAVTKQEAAESARRIADAKMQAAQDAVRAASAADLAQRERAEAQLRDAKAADKFASRAEKDKAGAHGGARAVTLRTYYTPEITDYTVFARHVWNTSREAMIVFLDDLAKQLVDCGKRDIPGVTILVDKRPV